MEQLLDEGDEEPHYNDCCPLLGCVAACLMTPATTLRGEGAEADKTLERHCIFFGVIGVERKSIEEQHLFWGDRE
jgi:hypothetical protein